MTSRPVFPFPPEALVAENARCYLRRTDLSAKGPLRTGPFNFGGIDERWVIEISTGRMNEERWQPLEALVHQMDGNIGYVRAWDPARVLPRGRAAGIYQGQTVGGGQAFSDGQFFTDGTGFVDGGTVAKAGADTLRGSTDLLLQGLIPSRDDAFLVGDKLEVGGLLYMIVNQVRSNVSGEGLAQIRPRLRKPIKSGDTVNFFRPSSVFRLRTSSQGIVDRSRPKLGQFSVELIEIPEVELQ